MNSIERNSIFNFAGSIGWVIDRSGEEEQILGSTWIVGDRMAATCAIPIIPYAESLEALIIRLPCSRTVWGVRDAEFHPGCDRWMAKRAISQTLLYPPVSLANQQHNVVILKLTPGIPPLDLKTKERINKVLLKNFPQGEAGFSGRATNLELTSIIQTLVNARRQGTIVICDLRRRPIARIFCENGKISHAKFGQAFNEDAVYRLMCSSFNGFFYLQLEKQPEWCDFPAMEKSTAGLLLEAYRRLEDKTQIIAVFGGESTLIFKTVEELGVNGGPPVQPDSTTVWSYLYSGMPISRLLGVCDLDGSQVMKGLHELVNARYITLAPPEEPAPFSTACDPLPMTEHAPMDPGSELYAISLDPVLGPYHAPGRILGPRQEDDPVHQIHTIALPEQALGSPIFMGSEVVGIYCGELIPTKYDSPEFAHGQQMLTAESINNCTGSGLIQPQARVARVGQVAAPKPRPTNSGVNLSPVSGAGEVGAAEGAMGVAGDASAVPSNASASPSTSGTTYDAMKAPTRNTTTGVNPVLGMSGDRTPTIPEMAPGDPSESIGMAVNTGTHQTVTTGTHQTISTGTHQTINTGTHQTINTGTHQTINTGTHQTINTGTHETITTGTHAIRESEASSTRNRSATGEHPITANAGDPSAGTDAEAQSGSSSAADEVTGRSATVSRIHTTTGTHSPLTTSSTSIKPIGDASKQREAQSASGSHSPISSLLGSLSAVFQPFSKNRKSQAAQTWIEIELTRMECGSTQWSKATSSTMFRAGDLLRLQIRLLQDAYLYAMFQGSNSKNSTMLYPEALDGAVLLAKSTVIAIPGRQSDQTLSAKNESGKFSLLGLPIPSTARGGTESLLLLASKTPLAPLRESKNVQQVFTNGTILLNGQRNLELVEMEEHALYEGLGLGDGPPNIVAITKLRVSHGS